MATYLLLSGTGIRAQSGPEGGGNELQVWTGGGRGLNGSTSDTGVWNLGVRYGWVLTDAVGPGPLRGRFEYAVDVVPVFLLTQRNGTAYGIGDRKSTRLNSSHSQISYAVFCLKKKK